MSELKSRIFSKDFATIVLAYASFIILGIPGAYLGAAWPLIQGDFALSESAVGALFLTTTIGYFIMTTISGQLVERFGVGVPLLLSTACFALGIVGYAIAPSWEVIVLLGLLRGAGAGFIDAGMNTYVTAHFGPLVLNWLHACFGIGAAVGPLLMNVLIGAELSWQVGYVAIGVAAGLVALTFLFTMRWWRVADVIADENAGENHDGRGPTLQATFALPLVWIGVGFFLLCSGIEASIGQWGASLFNEARGVELQTANAWVSIYWTAFTIGRVVFGVIAYRFPAISLIRFSMAGLVAGTVLVSLQGDTVNVIGMAVAGFALGPTFPLMISETPDRIGKAHTPNAIGVQIGAASVGIAMLPSLAGLLAERTGLEIVGPFFIVMAVGMFALHEISVYAWRRKAARS